MGQSDETLITTLPAEPQTSEELHALTTRLVLERPTADLIVDLEAVDEPTYESICRLAALCRVLSDCGGCCTLYNVSTATRKVFELYGFDRVFQILETPEIVLTPSPEHVNRGILELHGSKERRKYVRFRVPSWAQVDVLLWHGGSENDYNKLASGHHWVGKLVDISEGGIQVAVEATEEAILGKGRLIGVEFRLNPNERALIFDAQIREALPTADGESICLGLQFIGLEANPANRQGLQKLCNPGGEPQ